MSTVKRWAVLFRGINVGGRNKVPMAELRALLEGLGYTSVSTYIASGNVILESAKDAATISEEIESATRARFNTDELVKILVLSQEAVRAAIDRRPPGFGDEPDNYNYDAIFLFGLDAEETLKIFSPREGVDTVWAGPGLIYSRRLKAQITKSRLNKILEAPEYRKMTIRNWNTTLKLAELVSAQAP